MRYLTLRFLCATLLTCIKTILNGNHPGVPACPFASPDYIHPVQYLTLGSFVPLSCVPCYSPGLHPACPLSYPGVPVFHVTQITSGVSNTSPWGFTSNLTAPHPRVPVWGVYSSRTACSVLHPGVSVWGVTFHGLHPACSVPHPGVPMWDSESLLPWITSSLASTSPWGSYLRYYSPGLHPVCPLSHPGVPVFHITAPDFIHRVQYILHPWVLDPPDSTSP